MNAKIDQAVALLRTEAVETLQAWIQIPSVEGEAAPGAPFGANVKAMLDRALADAQAMGFETRNFDGYIGDVTMGAGEKMLGILAHLDVVPEGEGWQHPPFGAEIDEGKIYGRGVSDDKGPAVAALYAMKAVQMAGLTPKMRVRLILGCDEESGWEDIKHYQKHTAMPDFGFSPDAGYPVINTEKGIVHVAIDADLVGEEGADIQVLRIVAGERANVIPGVAEAEVACADAAAFVAQIAEYTSTKAFDLNAEMLDNGRVRIISKGIPGHAAMPEGTRNAAGQLLMALAAVGAGGGSLSFIEKLAQSVGIETDGKSLGIASSDAVSGPLTLNLGILRVENGHAHAVLDIRYPVLVSEDALLRTIALQVEVLGASVKPVGGHAPLHVPKESMIVQSLLAVYAEVTGNEPYTIAIGGGTYARSMDQCVAFGSSFPGDPDVAHQADESMALDTFLINMRIFAHAIARLACE